MKDLRHKVDQIRSRYQLACQQVQEEKRFLQQAREKVQYTQESQQVVQQVAENIQASAHKKVSAIVTKCLRAVFGKDSYQFTIRFQKRRGKTDAELLFLKGDKVADPLFASGGGVVDVASLALRLACLTLTLPRKRRLLVLDEPCKHLSRQFRPRMRKLLLALARELDLQIIQVTHAPELACGKVVNIGDN